jgi:hypothetical protein
MRRINWKTTPLSIAIIALLVFTLNPELRALLLVIDFLGVDLVLLLLGGYLSRCWPTIAHCVRLSLISIACGLTQILKSLRWIGYGLHPLEGQWAQVDHIGLVSGIANRIAVERFHR